MTNSILRAALLSSASLVLPAIPAVILPSEAAAQTVCTADAGNNITCADGPTVVAEGTTDATSTVVVVPEGLIVSNPGAVTLSLTPGSPTDNTITTTGNSRPGLSVGGGGAITITAPDVNVHTSGTTAHAFSAVGPSLTASLGDIQATNNLSYAILVGVTGAIDIEAGDISAQFHAIDINGGGGAIDLTTGTVTSLTRVAVDINGTGAITLNSGDISTAGATASTGVSITGGNGAISVTTGNVSTVGATSNGIAIASGPFGGVTVDAGNISTQGNDSLGLTVDSGSSSITAETGNVTTLGSGATGVFLTTLNGIISYTGGLISTAGDNAPGVNLSGGLAAFADIDGVSTSGADSTAVTINSGNVGGTIGNIVTTGDNAHGLVVTASGPVNLTVGDVTTSSLTSLSAIGVRLNGGTDAVSLTTGDITTFSFSSLGVFVTADGAITVETGNVSTAGGSSDGVNVQGDLGTISVTTDNVSTLGPVSFGINAFGLGDIAIDSGNISTGGTSSVGLSVRADGAITADVGNVATLSDGSTGIRLRSDDGPVTADIGNVSTAGIDSVGIQISAIGAVDLTCQDVSTQGTFSHGVTITSESGVTLQCGNVTTTSTDLVMGSRGILIGSDSADGVSVTVGNVSTAGGLSNAIDITGDDEVSLVAGNVSASGGSSNAIDINAGGAIDVTADSVSAGGTGILIDGDTGAVTVDADDIDAGGFALDVQATSGAIDLTVGNITAYNGGIVGTSGAITLDIGDIDTTGFAFSGAIGLRVAGGAGLVDVTTGDIYTAGENSPGINVTGSGNIMVDVGDVSTAGNFFSDGIRIQNFFGPANTIDLTFDSVATSGENSAGVLVGGPNSTIVLAGGNVITSGVGSTGVALGGVSVSGTLGNITTGNTSIGLSIFGGVGGLTTGNVSGGFGAVIVDAGTAAIDLTTGNASSTRVDSHAVYLTGTGAIDYTGGILSTAGNTSNGLQIDGGAGAIDVTIAGATTTGSGSNGIDISTDGAVDVTNTGAITLGGTGLAGISVRSTNGPITITSANITNNNTGTFGILGISGTGLLTINTGNVSVGTNGTAVNANADGDTTINVTGNLSGSIGVFASGPGAIIVNVNAGRTVTGTLVGISTISNTSETINVNGTVTGNLFALTTGSAGGTVNISTTGIVNGPFGGFTGADTINNAGRYNAFGASDFDGGADVFNNQAGGTLQVTGGATPFANLEAFNNAGAIIFADGAANDTLTISGNYAASGAANLSLDVVGTPTGNTADLLIVGGNITGTTVINPNFVNPAIDLDGVLVVDGGGTLGTNAFTLGTNTSQGLINYSLLTQGNNVLLVTTADEAIFDIGLLGSMSQDMWHQSADAYLACAASRRNEFGVARKSPVEICGQLYAGNDRYGDRNRSATVFGTALTYSDRLSSDRRGAQLDIGFRAKGKLHFGLTGGYEHAEANLGTGTDLDVEGHNIGAYAQYGGEAGFYAGLMVKRDSYDARIANPAGIAPTEVDGKSTGVDGEIGWRTGGFGALIDVNGGLSWANSKLDEFSTGNIAFDNASATSLRGRLGARLAWSGDWAPFVGGTLFHEFKGDEDIGIASGGNTSSFERRGRGTWARLEGGLGGGSHGGPLLSVWTDVGDVKGWGLRAGFRF